MRKVLCEKTKEWNYEKEWRLISRNLKIEVESDLAYIKIKPLAVIVGSHCQGDNRGRVIENCERIGVPVYGIYLSETSADFKLAINDDGGLEIASSDYIFRYVGK